MPATKRPDADRCNRLRVAAVQMKFAPTIDGNLAAIERQPGRGRAPPGRRGPVSRMRRDRVRL